MDVMAGYIAGPKAWRCPADDQGYFETYGTSYEYYVGYIITTISGSALGMGSIAQMVEVANKNPDLVPVFGDAAGFHPRPKDPEGRLWCYYDGHVDFWADEESIPEGFKKP